MKFKAPLTALITSLFLGACAENKDNNLQERIDEASPNVAIFAPSSDPQVASIIPLPNDLLFKDTADGTLNIPVENPTDFSNPVVAINTLDGFSTNTSMSTKFSAAIAPTSIAPSVCSQNCPVRIYEAKKLGNPLAPTFEVLNQLKYGVDFVVSVSPFDDTNLIISPINTPLKPSSTYLVAITKGVLDSNQKLFLAHSTYAITKRKSSFFDENNNVIVPALQSRAIDEVKGLEGLRIIHSGIETAIDSFDQSITSGDIILSWSFTTQSVGTALTALRDQTYATTPNLSTLTLVDTVAGAFDIYQGTLGIDYYLTEAATPNDPAPLLNFWMNAAENFLTPLAPIPVPTKQLEIPVVVIIPISKKPDTGWKTVIFQHGITRNRADAKAMTFSLTNSGYAIVAIDLPLHGIVDENDNLYTAGFERHFNLDFVTVDQDGAVAPGSDAKPDPSGTHFINLKNLLVSRDNIRQGVSDLFTLANSIPAFDYDADENATQADFDANNLFLVAHSLGGIISTTFLSLDAQSATPKIKAAVLAMTGGGIAKLLDGSANFGPQISAGLAALDPPVSKGSAQYESFFSAAQTILDTTDPINHALSAAAKPTLFIEIQDDQTIPNTVPDANDNRNTLPGPFSGSEPLANIMNLAQIDSSLDGLENDIQVWVKFNGGHHGSLLTNRNLLGQVNDIASQVFGEIRSQIISFLNSNGQSITITDASVIAAP